MPSTWVLGLLGSNPGALRCVERLPKSAWASSAEASSISRFQSGDTEHMACKAAGAL